MQLQALLAHLSLLRHRRERHSPAMISLSAAWAGRPGTGFAAVVVGQVAEESVSLVVNMLV